ncbi:MAG: alanine racemase [Chloroflexi bacterium]|nr:alanine racemase [Chloroflexota bacterium]
MLKWDLETPALVVDADRMEANIREMAETVRHAGVGLRPHAKTHKTPEIARLQVASGATGVTVAKLGEAEVLAGHGIEEFLVCFPPVGEQKIERLLALMERAKVMVTFDSLAVAEPLSAAAVQRGVRVDVLVDVDAGLHRMGVAPGPDLLALVQAVQRLPGLRLRGIDTHEGDVYGSTSVDDLRARAERVGRTMAETAADLRRHGVEVQIVSTGATPSARFIATVPGVTEIRPGTYVFNDRTQMSLGVVGLDQCAAAVLATVVSTAAPDRAVVDAGTKCLSSDMVARLGSAGGYGLVKGHEGWLIERANEEHGMLRLTGGPDPLSIGQKVEIVPNHVCPVVNLFDEMAVVQGEKVVDRWTIAARGRVR